MCNMITIISTAVCYALGWTLGVGDGQGGLACCSSWGCKESDTTERLNWTEQICYLWKGFPCGSVVKKPLADVRHMDPISELGRSPEERNNNPLRYFCLRNPMDRGAWWATVHGVTKRVRCDLANKQQHYIWKLLGDTVVYNLPAMQEIQETWVSSLNCKVSKEKGMATHSITCLENSMDRGDWQATVLGVTKSQTWLSVHTHTHFSTETPKKENENSETMQIIEHASRHVTNRLTLQIHPPSQWSDW